MKTDTEILDSYKQGNIVYMTKEGLKEKPSIEFLQQTSTEILTALNRTEDLILKVHAKKPDSLKWINDYAVAKTIEGLRETINDLANELVETQSTVSVQAESNADDFKQLVEDHKQLQNSYNDLCSYCETLKDNIEKTTYHYNSLWDADTALNNSYLELYKAYNNEHYNYQTAQDTANKIAYANKNLQETYNKVYGDWSALVDSYNALQLKYDALVEDNIKISTSIESYVKRIDELQRKVGKLSQDFVIHIDPVTKEVEIIDNSQDYEDDPSKDKNLPLTPKQDKQESNITYSNDDKIIERIYKPNYKDMTAENFPNITM